MKDSTIDEQINKIEEEIFNTQKNKATEHHIGKLKAKIARLRDLSDIRKSTITKGKGFAIKKSGDATIGLIGFPSVGKSTLLNKLTDANSRVGEYEFTTLDVIPGMMLYNGAKIQILDLPGLITGAYKGKGRGREILSAIRNVDLILFMIDSRNIDQLDLMTRELDRSGIRLNQKKPDVTIKKTGQGGINVKSTIKLTRLSEITIKSISSEYITNGEILIREDIDEDQLIDVFMDNRIYVPSIVVINKKDLVSNNKLSINIKKIKNKKWNVIAISAAKNLELNQLKSLFISELNLMRIFMKPIGKDPDYDEPLILKKGQNVEDACKKLHRDFIKKFRYAQIWGKSAKYSGQKVGLEHILSDNDLMTIVISR
ncbi:OBG GTPase family GTP-binding protein [Thermoplasmatota archaeon]